MTGKLIGAILIICGCGGMGFAMAASFRREESTLRQLLAALDYMECELQYHLTPLPELCRQAASGRRGAASRILNALATELENQIEPDVHSCMNAALALCPETPRRTREAFELMGMSLGRFDMDGQLKGLEAVRAHCRRELVTLEENRDTRLRSYQTLGLCAGAALAILLI